MMINANANEAKMRWLSARNIKTEIEMKIVSYCQFNTVKKTMRPLQNKIKSRYSYSIFFYSISGEHQC